MVEKKKTETVKLSYAIHKIGEEPKWKKSKSFLLNFANVVKMNASEKATMTNAFVNIDGESRDHIQSATYPITPMMWVGDKTEPATPTPNNYKLEQAFKAIAATIDPTQNVGSTVVGNKSYFILSGVFVLSETKTITEIGFSNIQWATAGVQQQIMLFRDVLSPPVDFTGGIPYAVSYKLEFEA